MLERQSIKTVALPAAGATAVTASLDFGSANPGPQQGNGRILLRLPALPNLVSTKKVTVDLQHSADDVSFENIPGTGNMSVTGPTSGGSAAQDFRLYLPPQFKRYVRASVAVEAAGGDNTAQFLTLALEL